MIVVGAGMAGLAAARTLHDAKFEVCVCFVCVSCSDAMLSAQSLLRRRRCWWHCWRHSLQVVVLEARQRIGGRVHTLSSDSGDGAFLEVGCTFLSLGDVVQPSDQRQRSSTSDGVGARQHEQQQQQQQEPGHQRERERENPECIASDSNELAELCRRCGVEIHTTGSDETLFDAETHSPVVRQELDNIRERFGSALSMTRDVIASKPPSSSGTRSQQDARSLADFLEPSLHSALAALHSQKRQRRRYMRWMLAMLEDSFAAECTELAASTANLPPLQSISGSDLHQHHLHILHLY